MFAQLSERCSCRVKTLRRATSSLRCFQNEITGKYLIIVNIESFILFIDL